jgi:hypothetical protein
MASNEGGVIAHRQAFLCSSAQQPSDSTIIANAFAFAFAKT